ncbi:MAG: hypothetical protein HZB77_03075, partial [Chloroflexi bacterium]|nr:hypothetical protein [Chloroflexota bacterium]
MILVSAMYLFIAFIYMPSGFYWSPDTGYKRIQADTIHFSPFPNFAIRYTGQEIDPDFKFLPFAQMFHFVGNGEVRLTQTPIIALLSKPFIMIMGERGEIVVPLLAGLISVYFIGWITERS